MDLVLAPSRAGPLFCRAGSLYLHSPYEPEREAERWLETQIGAKVPLFIVLLGPCLNYLTPLLRARYPRAAIVSLQPDPFFRGKELARCDATWYPDSPMPLAAFLDTAIGEDAAAGLSIMEWPPAARAFPEMLADLREALRSSLERLAGSAATVKSFGKRWFANACRSFLLVERLREAPAFASPIVVAAAGPSLGASLRTLRPYRDRFALIAVASALAACGAAGLEPDLVVSTDGGFWSRSHLYPLALHGLPLAAPLTALPSSRLWAELDILLLNQGSFVERELLPSLGGGLRLPPHGTVTGSALRLAAERSAGPIIFAGLDLAIEGEREHSSPHAFDPILAEASGRLSPLAALSFARALEVAPHALKVGAWRASRNLATYAGALVEDARSLAGRLFRLSPSPVELPGFVSVDESTLPSLLANATRHSSAARSRNAPPADLRRSRLGEALAGWRKSAREAAFALAEGAPPADNDLRELYRSFDLPDWAAARRASIAGSDPRPAAKELARRTDEALADIERRLLG